MAEQSLKEYTIKEYLDLEEQSLTKSAYGYGQIRAMSGGTLNHGIISNNTNTASTNQVRAEKTDCIPINGDVRIFMERAESFVYPDGMVICGAIESAEDDPHSVVNPMLIVEVLSKSTERYDRGDKFHKYGSLPSFKEYVLIDQYKPVVDVLYRAEPSSWKMTTTIGLDKSIYLNTLNFHLPLRELYRHVQGLSAPQFRLEL